MNKALTKHQCSIHRNRFYANLISAPSKLTDLLKACTANILTYAYLRGPSPSRPKQTFRTVTITEPWQQYTVASYLSRILTGFLACALNFNFVNANSQAFGLQANLHLKYNTFI